METNGKNDRRLIVHQKRPYRTSLEVWGGGDEEGDLLCAYDLIDVALIRIIDTDTGKNWLKYIAGDCLAREQRIATNTTDYVFSIGPNTLFDYSRGLKADLTWYDVEEGCVKYRTQDLQEDMPLYCMPKAVAIILKQLYEGSHLR